MGEMLQVSHIFMINQVLFHILFPVRSLIVVIIVVGVLFRELTGKVFLVVVFFIYVRLRFVFTCLEFVVLAKYNQQGRLTDLENVVDDIDEVLQDIWV